MSKHIIIFSHGFGVRKDSHGLFDAMKNEFDKGDIESIMFDYNEIDEKNNLVTVKPFSEQSNVLKKIIENARLKYPDAIVDIIAHSQGGTVVALLKPKGIRKAIFCAPFFHTNIERVRARYLKFPSSELNFYGISKRLRSDGSTTIIPAKYWAERFELNLYEIYNSFAKETDLTIINANQDEVLDHVDYSLLENCRVLTMDGKHDFGGIERNELIKTIKNIIMNP